MRRFSLPALVLLCALYATTGQPDPKKAKPPKPPKDMKIPPEMKPPKGPKPPKPPMPPGAKGAKPDKKFDAKNPDFMKHKPPTQDRDQVRGPLGKKGKRRTGRRRARSIARDGPQMNKMHDWWCKESEDRMSTELCSTWYEQLRRTRRARSASAKVRPPIEQVEEMHDAAFCAQEGNAELEPCMMWSKGRRRASEPERRGARARARARERARA